MKKINILLFTCIFVAVLTFPFKASAEIIHAFNSNIIPHKDASMDIKEIIKYDAETTPHHGIIRSIPTVYKNLDGKNFQIELTVISVTDDKGMPINYATSYDGSQDINIKIGDADITFTGPKTYIITYTTKGIVTYFSDHDEIYWNVTGDKWTMPIEHSEAVIDFTSISNGVADFAPHMTCYTGLSGSTLTDCNFNYNKIASKASFTKKNIVAVQEGWTIASSFPKGLVDYYEIKPLPDYSWIWIVIIIYELVVTVLAVPAAFFIWYKNGRDPVDNTLIVRQYDPPMHEDKRLFTPLETGAIMNEAISNKDISAEIVNLAVKKYIKLSEQTEKTFIFSSPTITFERGPAYAADPELAKLSSHEKLLFKALKLDDKESTKLEGLRESFHDDYISIVGNIFKSLTDKGYFPEKPEKTVSRYGTYGCASMFAGWFLFGFLMMVISKAMPKKTLIGLEKKRHVQGLKQFLVSQDRQFEFQEKEFDFFEKLLPYAISLDVAKIWANRFKNLGGYQNQIISTQNGNIYNTVQFVSILDHDLGLMNQTYSYSQYQSRSSSGFSSGFSGGSSGGGFGGGGGSSW